MSMLKKAEQKKNKKLQTGAKEWVCGACHIPNINLRQFCRMCSAPRR